MRTQTTNRWTYEPNGVQVSFAYDNLCLNAADMQVAWIDSLGNALALPGYQVTGMGNPAGGAVVFNSAPAIAAGSILALEIFPSEVSGAPDPSDFKQEPAAARGYRYDQALILGAHARYLFRRAIQASPFDDDDALVIPPPDSRKGMALLFDAIAGQLTVGAPLTPGAMVVAAWLIPRLADANAAAFLGNLGFSAFVRGLLNLADAPTFRTAIGAVSAVQVEAPPQGRLTLLTGAPVMAAAQTGRTIVYYTPYVGQLVPIWDGASMVPTVFAELQNDTTQAATNKAGPAAVGNNSNYDLFVWNDGGTIRLTRGPAWSSDTARGAGAGTTELQRVQGLWTNKQAIANGPAANFGTYVGTVRSNGAAQIDWNPMPAASAGGSNAILGVFNAYNRVQVNGQSQDSTASWTYNLGVWRALNASNANRISYIDGLAEVAPSVTSEAFCSSTGIHYIGVGRDSIVATPPLVGTTWSTNAMAIAAGGFQPSLGFHYLQAMETDATGVVSTVFGSGNPGGVAAGAQLNTLSARLSL